MGGITAARTLFWISAARRRTAATLLVAVAVSTPALAQNVDPTNPAPIRMISAGQAGGGGLSTGASFSLEGTIGQTVAAPMSGGAFRIQSGFVPMCPSSCEPGDLDCDGNINGGDLGVLLLSFGECPDPFDCSADLDGNGEVDAGDISLMLVSWH